ncbi:hypothetical protein CPL00168_CDS0006 [Escherichia phage MatMar]
MAKDYSSVMGLSCPGCLVDSTRYNIDGTGVCGSESIIAGKVVFFKERVEGYNIFVDHKEGDAVVAGVAIRSNITTTVNEEDGYSDYKEGDSINILTRGVVWCLTQTIESAPEHGDLVYVNNDGFVASSDGDEIVDGWIFTGDFYKFDETMNIVGVRITPLHHRKYLLTGAIIEAENGYVEGTETIDNVQLKVTVVPTWADDKTGQWTITNEQDPKVASVSRTGLVVPTGVGGHVNVNWTANDGSGVADQFDIVFRKTVGT